MMPRTKCLRGDRCRLARSVWTPNRIFTCFIYHLANQSGSPTDPTSNPTSNPPFLVGQDWNAYFKNAAEYTLALAAFTQHPAFVTILFSMREGRRSSVLHEVSHVITALNSNLNVKGMMYDHTSYIIHHTCMMPCHDSTQQQSKRQRYDA